MSLFIDTLEDEEGLAYQYGHCYADDDEGGEHGCGMEYAWYGDLNLLQHWHDAVGLVTTVQNFTRDDALRLEEQHALHVPM